MFTNRRTNPIANVMVKRSDIPPSALLDSSLEFGDIVLRASLQDEKESIFYTRNAQQFIYLWAKWYSQYNKYFT